MLEELAQFLLQLEGFRSDVYLDTAGIETIGIGTLWKEGMPRTITQEEALELCAADCRVLSSKINSVVTVPLTINQQIALGSFCYNLGFGAFHGSTLRRLLNEGDYQGAADQFLVWDKNKVDGVETVVEGLHNRRVIERAKFLEQ